MFLYVTGPENVSIRWMSSEFEGLVVVVLVLPELVSAAGRSPGELDIMENII